MTAGPERTLAAPAPGRADASAGAQRGGATAYGQRDVGGRKPLDRRVLWGALALATAVAAALRLPFLGHQSLWFDETYTRQILAEPTLSALWRHVQRTESTPPLYYVIGWLAGARSAAAMRSIPALSLTAAVPVGYLAFRRLVGQRAALATAALLAVNPMLVWYATDARSYGLLVLTGLLTVWSFSAALERPQRARYGLWALAAAACVWTHYFGGFLVAAEAAVLLVAQRRGGRGARAGAAGGGASPTRRRAPVTHGRAPAARRLSQVASGTARPLLAILAIALMIGPLVPLATSQASSERAAFIEHESLGSRVVTTVRQFAMGPNVPRTWLEGAGLALLCLAFAVGAALALRSRRRSMIAPLALLLAAAGIPLLLALTGIEDRLYARNLLAALPLALAVCAPALLRLRAAPLALYLALALLTSVWVATDWRYEQVDWRGALARVEAREPHTPVIAITPYGAPVVATYLARVEAPAAGIATRSAWLVVEPQRGAHERALEPAGAPALPGFVAVGESRLEGFRIILLRAPRPTRIATGEVADAVVFPGRA